MLRPQALSPCILFGWAVAAFWREDTGVWTPSPPWAWPCHILGWPEWQQLHWAGRLLGATIVLALTPVVHMLCMELPAVGAVGNPVRER